MGYTSRCLLYRYVVSSNCVVIITAVPQSRGRDVFFLPPLGQIHLKYIAAPAISRVSCPRLYRISLSIIYYDTIL